MYFFFFLSVFEEVYTEATYKVNIHRHIVLTKDKGQEITLNAGIE